MQIGIDLSHKQICGVLICKNLVLATVTTSIYCFKRDSKKEIMDKMIGLIDSLFTTEVKAIGASLPTTTNPERGVIYDVHKIPHWKNIRLKTILEEKFRVPTYVNGDINCFILGEKCHGTCKCYKDLISITIDTSIGTSAIINNKLYSDMCPCFTQASCLSEAYFQCVRQYNDTYMRTLEELLYLYSTYNPDLDFANHEFWKSIGAIVGRLAVIMLTNFNAQAIVLGGELAASYDYCVDAIKDYVNVFKPSYVTDEKYIIPSEVKDAKAIGATFLASGGRISA